MRDVRYLPDGDLDPRVMATLFECSLPFRFPEPHDGLNVNGLSFRKSTNSDVIYVDKPQLRENNGPVAVKFIVPGKFNEQTSIFQCDNACLNAAGWGSFLMETWLVLSNCQTFGLANSLKLLGPRFHIDAMDVWGFKKNIEKYKEELPRYFRVIVHPHFRNIDFDFGMAQNLDFVPSINFDAYHPDICYAFSDGPIESPMGSYHSMIVLAAYEAGLGTEATRKLFRRDVFEACGFFARWEQERSQLLQHFSEHGLDISSSFMRWSRGDAFMYSVNHPKIRCIYDIAHTFLQRLGVDAADGEIMPADNLLNGPCYPVYPEIAETFGAKGSYLFKLPNEYRLISLEQFIEFSFGIYSRLPSRSIHVEGAVRPRYENVKTVIAEAA